MKKLNSVLGLVTNSSLGLFAVLAIAFPSGSAHAREVGLEIGNELKAVNFEGQVFVSCFDGRGGSTSATFFCQANGLEPNEYSRFVTSGPIDADHVYFRATRQDGSRVEKDAAFDGAKGKSRSEINLWISTLLQKPLLGAGRTEVAYMLTKNGQKITKGKFDVNVKWGGTYRCPSGAIQSNDLNDCRISTNACQRYFFDYRYCQ